MTKPTKGPSTRAIHGTPRPRQDHSPVVTPVYQSSTFVQPIGSTAEPLYTRYGNNPNQVVLAEKLALLEGAERAIFVASGMGATALAHLAVLRPGDHLLASRWIYGGTYKLFSEQFGKLGIEVSFIDPEKHRDWRRSVRDNTRAVFIETPTNPLVRVLDIEPLAELCRERGMVFLVDSTFASPINLRPLEHGADVVIHSATKYLNGHSDIIGGVVASSSVIVEEVRSLMQVWGQAPDPHAAWLAERGLKTLAVRVARQNANGQAFAEWAAAHATIQHVDYPGLRTHPDHAIAQRVLDGMGGMVGIRLPSGSAAEMFLQRLQLVTHAPSLGGVETLMSEPRYTSHASFTPAERSALGMPDGFIRVSLGIEDIDDVIADCEAALRSLTA